MEPGGPIKHVPGVGAGQILGATVIHLLVQVDTWRNNKFLVNVGSLRPNLSLELCPGISGADVLLSLGFSVESNRGSWGNEANCL